MRRALPFLAILLVATLGASRPAAGARQAAAQGAKRPAAAKPTAAKPGPKPTVALFITTKGDLDASVTRSIEAVFNQLADAKLAKILSGDALQKRLRTAPDAAITKCGPDLKCIAKLGAKADATRVVFARAVAADGGLAIQMLAIGVKSRAIENKASLKLGSSAEIQGQLAPLAHGLCGVTASPEPGGELPSSDSNEPPLVAAATTSPSTAATGTTVASRSSPSPTTTPASRTTATDRASAKSALLATLATNDEPDLLATPPDPGAPRVAALTPVQPDPSVLHQPAPSAPTPWLTYTGIAVGAIGIGVGAAGGYFGVHAGSLADSITYGQGGTTQLEARDLDDRAARETKLANTLYISAGATAAVGLALVLVDQLLLGKSSEPTPALSVGPTGAAAVWQW